MGTTTNTTNANTNGVGFAALNSANMKLNNAQNEARKYDVAANVNIKDSEITLLDSGSAISKDGKQVAMFSMVNGKDIYDIRIYGTVADEDRGDVLADINSFILGAKAYAATNTLTTAN